MHTSHLALCLLLQPPRGLAAFLFPAVSSSCEALEVALPGKVVYPGTAQYSISNDYWSSRQSELTPPCFVWPSSTSDVSTILRLLGASRTPFTVKSGGHAAFGTGSSIRDGVTIDLGAMNDITVSSDQSTVSVGPGARWYDVARVLDPLGLAVVGGRQADVGVSGLILGGGNSFLSGRRGWACDNVQNFEIVLASGALVNANPNEHSDLFWALRGGGGASFGIVTRFDLDAYEQGEIWAKMTTWPASEISDVLVTFAVIAREVLHIDKDAHLFVMLGYFLGAESPVVATMAFHLDHTNPPNGLFDTFEGLARLPRQISNETYIRNMSGLLDFEMEQEPPDSPRKTLWDTTIRDGLGSGAFLDNIVSLWTEYAEELRAAALAKGTAVNPSLVIQPITNPTIQEMQKNGGNALGLEPGEFPLFLITPLATWEDRSLDCLIEKRSQEFINSIDRLAEQQGFGHGFKYLNYAGKTQDVFPSYGRENHERLRNIAKRYDPDGVLRQLWKGYFKVYGVATNHCICLAVAMASA